MMDAIQPPPTPRKRFSHPPARSLGLFLIGIGLLLLGMVTSLILPSLGSNGNLGSGQGLVPAKLNVAAPSLLLSDLTGKTVSLADYAGNIILVNNWATWCPPCREEMPVLQAYYQDHWQEGFVLIGIEAGDPAEEVQAFVQQFGLTFPIWLDPEIEALRAFRNNALPNSYLIDRQGKVILGWTGALNRETLEKYITPLLEE